MYFNRFDICESYWAWAVDVGDYALLTRLCRMGFVPSRRLNKYTYQALTDNGRAIYDNIARRVMGGQHEVQN